MARCLSLALALVLLSSCDGGECMDCGPCGLMGGPVSTTHLQVRTGLDPDGAPAAEVNLFRKGDCGFPTEGRAFVWDGDAVVEVDPVEVTPLEGEPLPEAAITVQMLDRVSTEIVFTSPTLTQTVRCFEEAGEMRCEIQ